MRLFAGKMFSVRVFSFIACVLVVNGELVDQYKTVETTDGRIRGIKNVTFLKSAPYYSYKGIPYAKPPIGDLRFKVPEPVESWKPNVLDAFEYGNICVQPGRMMPNPLPQSEDCLTLNIFVPADVDPNEKLAVLFYIHGGGFTEGAGDDHFYGPDFIIEKQTILVTINYRLGIFGFLSLNSVDYSGNMGLKDQQLALKWISENIEQFGGDSKRIAIFGHSAGGASTHYHILSDESRKYFRSAIPMSGSVANRWAMSPEKHHLERAFQIAKELGKPQNSYEELVAFLKTESSDTLNQFSSIEVVSYALFIVIFGPVVERKDAKQPFLVDLPEEVYKSSKIEVNAMFTVLSNEAMSVVPKTPDALLQMLDANFNVPLPFSKYNLPLESEEHLALAKEIRQFYFGDATIDEKSIPKFVELLSDINFALGIDKSVKALATQSKGKTYYTFFSVDSKLNTWKNLDTFKRGGEIVILPGAGHGDDLCYLFRCGMALSYYDEIVRNSDDEHSEISLKTIEYITKIFTNFAKYGEPSHENDLVEGLQSIQEDHVHFITFDNDGLKPSLNPHQDVIDFWTRLEEQASKFSAQSDNLQRDEL